jgi:SAM-dependent methyltransferase
VYARDRFRFYRRCVACSLIFVPREGHVTVEAEKRRYDQHRNAPDDEGYVRFLARLPDALVPKLEPGVEGLDFGCGPSAVLAGLLRGRGFPMAVYDPFYATDAAVLDREYDFVTCTEVVEHFRDPAAEFTRLFARVKPGGWLGILTSLWEGEPAGFVRWRYAMDETHVAFYCRATLEWVARRHGATLDVPAAGVILCRRGTPRES